MMKKRNWIIVILALFLCILITLGFKIGKSTQTFYDLLASVESDGVSTNSTRYLWIDGIPICYYHQAKYDRLGDKISGYIFASFEQYSEWFLPKMPDQGDCYISGTPFPEYLIHKDPHTGYLSIWRANYGYAKDDVAKIDDASQPLNQAEQIEERVYEDFDVAPTLTIDADSITQIYLRWGYTYDLLVAEDQEPSLFSYLVETLTGEYSVTGIATPTEGAILSIYLYGDSGLLYALSPAPAGQLQYENYSYRNDSCTLNFQAILNRLTEYESEENRLELNTVTGEWYRAGSYGAEIVEIP